MHRTALHVLAAVLLTATTASADQLLLGRKLLIKSPPSGPANNKVVHLAKDSSITLGAAGGAGDPQCTGSGGGGGSLRIVASGGSGDMTISLPCAGWTANAANTLYKYTDPTGATCKLVLVKSGVLAKAVCKGAQVAIDLDGTMSPVAVVTTLNTESYCTEFGGTAVHDGSDDKTFLRKDAAAPGSCAASAPTTTTSSTPAPTTTTSSLPTCGLEGSVCGGSCPGGVVCSLNYTSLDCECPTTTQCEAGTCFGDSPSCAGCPSCPAGYTCGTEPSSVCGLQGVIFGCVGPTCGSDCSCPAGGHCTVTTPTTITTTTTITTITTTTTTTTMLPVPCGGAYGSCGGTCSGGNFCSNSFAAQSCICVTAAQCQAGACTTGEGFENDPSCSGGCPTGYTCTVLGIVGGNTVIHACMAGACGSDCTCPLGGFCRAG